MLFPLTASGFNVWDDLLNYDQSMHDKLASMLSTLISALWV